MTLVCPSPQPTFSQYPFQHPHYSHSSTSSQYSASSPSSSSIWSVASVSSSVATSVSSTTLDYAPPTARISHQPSFGTEHRAKRPALARHVSKDITQPPQPPPPLAAPSEPVPIEQRQHPRRTSKSTAVGTSDGCPPPLPTLQRQADRKVNFVENLVDSAAQIVETIWTPPKYVGPQPAPADKVLPLRTFIQETLRRSRTSYSTLQVALYYLIVIRPRLPAKDIDISSLDPLEAQLVRAMQCGRRMFLAALILASKYLQDRNYSARAWSRISGLNTQEININEMAFLKAVDWKLHITEAVFQKWTDLVLKYTQAPSPSPVSPTRTSQWSDDEDKRRKWCKLVETLSPDLHEEELTPSAGPRLPCEVDSMSNSPIMGVAEPVVAPTPVLSSAPIRAPTPKALTPPPHHPPTIRKSKSNIARVPSPLTLQPPRTLEPQLQDTNAFKALHQAMSTTFTAPPIRRSSTFAPGSSQPIPAAGQSIESGDRRPGTLCSLGLGSAMAGAAQVARTSMLDCAREAWAVGRHRPGTSAQKNSNKKNTDNVVGGLLPPGTGCARRSSLATSCIVSDRNCPTAQPRPHAAFKRQNTDGLKRQALSATAASAASSSSLSTPTSNTITTTSALPYATTHPASSSCDLSYFVSPPGCASPRSREAAMSLHQLRDAVSPALSFSTTTTAASSACSTPVMTTAGRKRSADHSGGSSGAGGAVALATSMTPKFRAVGLIGSPGCSAERKRVRCVMDSPSGGMTVEGWRAGVAQNVR